MRAGSRRRGLPGGRRQLDRVGGQVEQRGSRGPGQLGRDRDQVDRFAVGERREPAVEQRRPHRTDPGDAGGAQHLGRRAAGPAVRLAVLVEERPGAGEPTGRAAGRTLGGAVQRDPGQRGEVGVPVVHQDRAAQPHGLPVPGGREQREQHGMTGQVDPAVPGSGAHRICTEAGR
jgi:hypothetical protein